MKIRPPVIYPNRYIAQNIIPQHRHLSIFTFGISLIVLGVYCYVIKKDEQKYKGWERITKKDGNNINIVYEKGDRRF